MKNKNWYAAFVLAGLFTLSGTASAHDMDKNGHHHMMCKSPDMKKDKAIFHKMHALHEKLHAVLVAPQFNKKAFLALSSQMEQLRSQIAQRHAEAFANMAAKLPQEEREHMMNRFHEHAATGWQHHSERSHNNQTHDWVPPSAR